MPRFAVDIAAPASDVYARIADPRKRPAWLPELQATSDVPDRPLEAGDRFVGYATAAGHRVVGHSEITVADHATAHLEERVVIGARFRTSWTVTPDETGQGCRVAQEIEFDFPQGAAGRVERWVLERYAARMQRVGLERLAQLTSGGGATRNGSGRRRRSRWLPRRSARSSP